MLFERLLVVACNLTGVALEDRGFLDRHLALVFGPIEMQLQGRLIRAGHFAYFAHERRGAVRVGLAEFALIFGAGAMLFEDSLTGAGDVASGTIDVGGHAIGLTFLALMLFAPLMIVDLRRGYEGNIAEAAVKLLRRYVALSLPRRDLLR